MTTPTQNDEGYDPDVYEYDGDEFVPALLINALAQALHASNHHVSKWCEGGPHFEEAESLCRDIAVAAYLADVAGIEASYLGFRGAALMDARGVR